MYKEQNDQETKYLPSHLLDDDDTPTTSSIKNNIILQKTLVFSAPPIFVSAQDRIYQDFFDIKPQKVDPYGYKTPQKPPRKQSVSQIKQEEQIFNNQRKLSLQNEQQYYAYQNYQNNTLLAQPSFFPTFSLQQQILNNIHYVTQWCRDQYGSRNIQQALLTSSFLFKNKIFQAILPFLQNLIYDKFGNYVVQKYFQIGTQNQKQIIYTHVKKQILFITLHNYGCRVIQKIIDASQFQIQKQKDIIDEIKPNFIQISMNQNGNHIAQKIFELFNEQNLYELSLMIKQNLQKLSFHAFGCRVVQKYLQSQKCKLTHNQIMKILIKLAVCLSKCQFGNYIMQYIVTNLKQFQEDIYIIIKQNFIELSCDKFASNVIQKLLKMKNYKFNQSLIQHIISSLSFIALSKHQYGNYVIQRLLQNSSKIKKNKLKDKLKQYQIQISKSQYGKHVLIQIQKIR